MINYNVFFIVGFLTGFLIAYRFYDKFIILDKVFVNKKPEKTQQKENESAKKETSMDKILKELKK